MLCSWSTKTYRNLVSIIVSKDSSRSDLLYTDGMNGVYLPALFAAVRYVTVRARAGL